MRLKKGSMKGAQRGSAVQIKGFSYRRGGKLIRVKGYRRGKPGGVRG